MNTSRLQSVWLSVALTLGLVMIFIGERLLVSGGSRAAMSLIGLALVAGALAWRAARAFGASGARRRVELSLLALAGLSALGLALYGVSSLVTPPLAESSPKLAVVLSALAPVLFLLSLLPTWLVEASYASMARAPVVEVDRTRDALRTGLGFGFVVVFAFCAVYVATERDVTGDFAYFRTARPSESTRKLVETLNAPLKVTLVYPPASEVHEKLREYFGVLQKLSPFLEVESLDQAVEPVKARELGINVNGYVVLQRESRKENFSLNPDIDKVRGTLKSLDGEIQKRMTSLVKAKTVVYLVSGHGELSDVRPTANDGRPTVTVVRELLRALNADVRPLSALDGLVREVPKDATVVLVLGPSEAMGPEERVALQTYAESGGKIWYALEPTTPEANALLNPLGLNLRTAQLVHSTQFVPQTRQVSDRANILTATYSSHPSVSALAKLGNAAPIGFLRAGALEQLPVGPAAVSNIDLTVRALDGTFEDENGDFEKGEKELSNTYPLVAAVHLKGGGRVIVQGDSDALGDPLLTRNPAQRAFFVDGMRWLMGEDALVGGGVASSEVDVPVVHTRKQDVWWFYGSVFLAPALVLGFGFIVTRRRARKARPGARAEVKE